jgi:hypothetical protein
MTYGVYLHGRGNYYTGLVSREGSYVGICLGNREGWPHGDSIWRSFAIQLLYYTRVLVPLLQRLKVLNRPPRRADPE